MPMQWTWVVTCHLTERITFNFTSCSSRSEQRNNTSSQKSYHYQSSSEKQHLFQQNTILLSVYFQKCLRQLNYYFLHKSAGQPPPAHSSLSFDKCLFQMSFMNILENEHPLSCPAPSLYLPCKI